MAKLEEFKLNHYFLYPQIGWNTKSSYVGKIQNKLNVGMDSILFIDDQAFERDEVKNVHPEVNVLQASDYQKLLSMPSMIPDVISKDASRRRMMYLEEQSRQAAEEIYEGTSQEFLASLNMIFTISEARTEDLERAVELTLRTN